MKSAWEGKRTRRRSRLGLAIAAAGLAIGLGTGLGGCRAIERKLDPVDMEARMREAPPIRLGEIDDRHLLIMQAPNPGWSFTIDKDEVSRHGRRVFITIRRPDPAYMYPQMIVEKQLLSDAPSSAELTIMARLLDANEKTKNRDYTVLSPVDSFQE